MSWKKFLSGVLAASIIFSASTFCSAAEESANAKLVRIEIDTYGAEQSGALLDRISALEKSYSGRNMSGNMNARIEAIYDILYDNSAEPAILAKINALEWNVNHEVAGGGIDIRLAALENQIFGKSSEGTFNERIRALAKASYGEEILPIAQVQVPANTLIKVETTAPVGSKVMQEGDSIPIRVIEDVFVDGSLVFARGLPGEGIVTSPAIERVVTGVTVQLIIARVAEKFVVSRAAVYNVVASAAPEAVRAFRAGDCIRLDICAA